MERQRSTLVCGTKSSFTFVNMRKRAVSRAKRAHTDYIRYWKVSGALHRPNGVLLISARPVSSRKCSLSWTFSFKFERQNPPFISKKGSHLSQDNECTIQSTPGSGYVYIYMLWFNFILGLNFIFLCFKLIIIHYHTQKQREIKFKPRIKLNHNIYINGSSYYMGALWFLTFRFWSSIKMIQST